MLSVLLLANEVNITMVNFVLGQTVVILFLAAMCMSKYYYKG